MTDKEKITRLEKASQCIDWCANDLGYYRCSVLYALVASPQSLVNSNRHWLTAAPKVDRYDVFNTIWNVSVQVAFPTFLPEPVQAVKQLPRVGFEGGATPSNRRVLKRAFLDKNSTEEEWRYLQRVQQLIASCEKGFWSNGTIRTEFGQCVSDLQEELVSDRAQRLRAAILGRPCAFPWCWQSSSGTMIS